MDGLDRGAQQIAVLVHVVFGDASAGLERVAGDPIDADAVTHDVSRVCEGRVNGRGVAALVRERFVGGVARPDGRRPGGKRVVNRDDPGEPSLRFPGAAGRRVPRPRAARSSPVKMARTPGARPAAEVSIARMSAWAYGERSTQARA